MTGYVMAATDADGTQLGERIVAAAPALGEVAAFGDSHRAPYVSVRRDHDLTLYGKVPAGAWSVLVAEGSASDVVEARRRHGAGHRPEPVREEGPQVGLEYVLTAEYGHVLTAIDVNGEALGQRFSATAPTPDEAAALGDLHKANYVIARPDDGDGHGDGDVVTLFGRDADGSWWVIAPGADVETAQEVCLWFDLTQHYRGGSSAGPGDKAGHPLSTVAPPESGRISAARAIWLVVEQIRARRLDYPTEGLTADRFDGGWSVYEPVDVDESDPMAFLNSLRVDMSVFLVSDLGRVMETSSSVPPQQSEGMFTAEEAYVRRRPTEKGASTKEVVEARASALLGPIAQQLALLGPQGWDRFAAVFSFTVSGEVAQLLFWSGDRSTEARVPQQIALLVRRQRHLAAQMPAGPWCRLLLTVRHTAGTSAQIVTDYDYGDEPLPDDHLLTPEQYRDDLAAYPRSHTPAWLSAHVARAGGSGAPPATAPLPDTATTRPSRPRQEDRPAPPATRQAPAPTAPAQPTQPTQPSAPTQPAPAPFPVLDTKLRRKRLYADPQMITYGKHSIALDQVEWVAYHATHTAHKGFLVPTTHDSTWEFSVGRYPYYGGPSILVHFYEGGRRAQQPAEWEFLVDLAGRYLLPRLLTELVDRVHRGETVKVGGSVTVDRHGVGCLKPRLSVPWASLGAVQPSGGMVCVYRAGVGKRC